MPKVAVNQVNSVREPRQERSRYKVQLIFEAAIRLLEKGGVEALTTNAIAESAGVSIGTLYQFFPNKEAILDSLADREFAEMSNRVTQVMQDTSIATTNARIAAVVQAVAASYGTRRGAHRLVMEYSLTKGSSRLSPLLAEMIAHLSSERKSGPITHAVRRADAFVMTQAFAGVLRAMVRQGADMPPQLEIVDALTRLVTRFIGLDQDT
jgi:AcrR family transcriptional regulator